MKHWLDVDWRQLRNIDMATRTTMTTMAHGDMARGGGGVGEEVGFGYWPQDIMTSLSPPEKTLQSPSTPLAPNPLLPQEPEPNTPEYRPEELIPNALEPVVKVARDEGDALNLIHPIPKQPSLLYITSRNMASFPGLKIETAPMPLFDTPGLHEECMVDADKFQKPTWANDTLGAALFLQRSPEGSSVGTVDNSFASIDSTCGPPTPLPWSVFGAPAPCDMLHHHHQEVSPSESLWTSVPCFSSTNRLYEPTNGPTQLTPTDDTLQKLTLLDTNTPYNTRPTLPQTTTNQIHLPTNPPIPHPYHPGSPNFTTEGERLRQRLLTGMTFTSHIELQNAFLLACKRRGMSYKDIKRMGGFKEAESTLRGRFRTLTKVKELRVRKPRWLEKDIRLLCVAVDICSETKQHPDTEYTSRCHPREDAQAPRVSWKKVAQYIWAHGGSYHFGNATCKKKWCEIHNVKI